MNHPAENTLSIDYVRRACLRHEGKMALFFLFVMAATALGTYLAPRAYRSQAKLFIRLGRENVTIDPTATLGQAAVVAVPPTRDTEINSAIEILTSRDLIDKVVDAVGPEAILGDAAPLDPPPASPASEADAIPKSTETGEITDRYKAILKLRKMIVVDAARRSSVISVQCDAASPATARVIVSKLVDLFLDQHMRFNRAPGAYRFLDEQATRLKTQLAATEDELRDLKNSTGMLSADAQRQVLVNRIARLEDELLQTNASAATAEGEAKALRDKLASLPKSIVTARTKGFPNQAADTMRGQLFTIKLKELELVTRHPEDHPDVRLIRKQIASANEVLAREDSEREQVTTGLNKLYEEAELALQRQETLLASTKARARALTAQIDQEKGEMKKFNANEVRIARLQRKLDLDNTHYRKYAESLEQGKIDRSLQAERISNINVVQAASLEPKPVKPSKLINGALGLLVAIGGSIGLALAAESRSRKKELLPEMNPTRNGVSNGSADSSLRANHVTAS
jgi:uncharacterized protein involved in exopolysaccharide biosynthesis